MTRPPLTRVPEMNAAESASIAQEYIGHQTGMNGAVIAALLAIHHDLRRVADALELIARNAM